MALNNALVYVTGGAAWAETGQPTNWQMGLQEAATPVQEFIISFHYWMVWLISLIVLFVLGLLVYVMVRFNEKAIEADRHVMKVSPATAGLGAPPRDMTEDEQRVARAYLAFWVAVAALLMTAVTIISSRFIISRAASQICCVTLRIRSQTGRA